MVLSSFSLPLCQCRNCRGRRGGGSLRVCVRGVSIPGCVVLASLKTSARFSSKLSLSVTPLKQWVHSFSRRLVYEVILQLIPMPIHCSDFNPACVRFDICNWGLQRICCCLRFTDSVAGPFSGVYNSLVWFLLTI